MIEHDLRPTPDPGTLSAALERLAFTLHPDMAALCAERDRLLARARAVADRARVPDAPLLAVVAGGSGAGKSTIVNTLAEASVSTAGILRPTTRSPVLVCHPDDRDWFTAGGVLGDLPRSDHPRASGALLRIVTRTCIPKGLGVLDTPDTDSVAHEHRRLAEVCLDAADVWVWLVTARSYADEAGMALLRRARDRSALLAVVLNQTPAGDASLLTEDLRTHLDREGVTPALLCTLHRSEPVDDRLPRAHVGPLRTWLQELAPADRRRAVREAAYDGLAAALPGELAPLVAAAHAETKTANALRGVVAAAYGEVDATVGEALDDGLPLREDVLARWRRLVGGGRTLLRAQQALEHVGTLVRSALGHPAQTEAGAVRDEVDAHLQTATVGALATARRHARAGLEATAAGRTVLDTNPALRVEPAQRRAEVDRTLADFHAHLAEVVEQVARPRQSRARALSTTLNAVATSAILVLFALSGGLTGGEVGIAAGAAAASQWLLLKLFGEQQLRRVLSDLRRDLLTRIGRLADEERAAFDDAITAAAPPMAALTLLERGVSVQAPAP